MSIKLLCAAGLAALAIGLGCFVLADSVPSAAPVRLKVHEWGTFTAMDDTQGQALPGINVDDEPVPGFVHQLSPAVLRPAHAAGNARPLAWLASKGVPVGFPLVTMRLETPVLYFYLPSGQKGPVRADIEVDFHGGWLTEFYPDAKSVAPGLAPTALNPNRLTPNTIGTLAWHDVRIGTSGAGPKTDEEVWLAPRRVQSVPVTTAAGESEKFLFYRGVGNIDAPLSVSFDSDFKEITARGRFAGALGPGQQATIGAMWLVHVRADGTTAYRTLPAATVTGDNQQVVVRAAATFSPNEFDSGALDRLKAELHTALVADGLFADEATALLNTWQRAYFRSPGLRLFFLVPRPWTDHYLPLRVSVPADITRVMVGRVELVSPEQREILARFSSLPSSDTKWINPPAKGPLVANWERFFAGHGDFGTLGIAIPPDYQAYLDLGRFRNALVLEELRRRPTKSLKTFVERYSIKGQY